MSVNIWSSCVTLRAVQQPLSIPPATPPPLPVTMPTGGGMFELKLRKKLLAQQLSVLDDKVDRMSRILDKRITQKGVSVKVPVQKVKPKRESVRGQETVVYKKLMDATPGKQESTQERKKVDWSERANKGGGGVAARSLYSLFLLGTASRMFGPHTV